ncbi:uncharacterized protein Dmul_04340 [Desulfococcus multivorans]|nr:uncharacterized protein Dmul_04340 [Desulfococcus multivorans]
MVSAEYFLVEKQYDRPWHFMGFSGRKGLTSTNEAVYGQEGAEAERKAYVLDHHSDSVPPQRAWGWGSIFLETFI